MAKKSIALLINDYYNYITFKYKFYTLCLKKLYPIFLEIIFHQEKNNHCKKDWMMMRNDAMIAFCSSLHAYEHCSVQKKTNADATFKTVIIEKDMTFSFLLCNRLCCVFCDVGSVLAPYRVNMMVANVFFKLITRVYIPHLLCMLHKLPR